MIVTPNENTEIEYAMIMSLAALACGVQYTQFSFTN